MDGQEVGNNAINSRRQRDDRYMIGISRRSRHARASGIEEIQKPSLIVSTWAVLTNQTECYPTVGFVTA